jgi:ceramide glucosyltransferase
MTSPSSLSSLLLYDLPLLIAALSALYFLAVFLASLKFHFETESSAEFTPPVSILKPVRGIEEGFYESLASHCRQDYPCFEIIFGLGDLSDPAQETIAQLRRDFPRVPIKLVVVSESRHANPKMNSLEGMIGEAAHEVVVINDADIRVEPDYLRNVVRPLAGEQVGLVTCLYRGIPHAQLVSVLEALSISGDFSGQVLLARWLEGIQFALGATIATRKKQIAEIGGLERWGDYLADDYILGNRIAAAGYRIHLSHTVVETRLPRRSLSDLLRQQLRWARTVRISRPRSYPGLLLTFGVPFAALAVMAEPRSTLALGILAITLAARLFSAWASGVLISRDPVVRRYFWLLPLRDCLGLGVWLASFLGSQVVWRGRRYEIERGGKIRPV